MALGYYTADQYRVMELRRRRMRARVRKRRKYILRVWLVRLFFVSLLLLFLHVFSGVIVSCISFVREISAGVTQMLDVHDSNDDTNAVEPIFGLPDPFADAAGIVILDAGHGGYDVGCNRGDLYEKDICLSIVQNAARMLEQKGYKTILTRTDDTYVSLDDRVILSNNYREKTNAVFVSVHVNALEEEDPSVSGLECYCTMDANENSRTFADLIMGCVSASTGAACGKLEADSDFYVVRNNRIPSCLLETGFISNETERKLLADAKYQQKIAAGIADGVDQFFSW